VRVSVRVCACVSARVSARVCACTRMCARGPVSGCACVHACVRARACEWVWRPCVRVRWCACVCAFVSCERMEPSLNFLNLLLYVDPRIPKTGALGISQRLCGVV
jgi:hypothetical protein